MKIEDTLSQRAATHGQFKTHAKLAVAMRDAFTDNAVSELDESQIEALTMIFHKIARIGNGNPNYHDHWHDIAGYATLVANELLESTK